MNRLNQGRCLLIAIISGLAGIAFVVGSTLISIGLSAVGVLVLFYGIHAYNSGWYYAREE